MIAVPKKVIVSDATNGTPGDLEVSKNQWLKYGSQREGSSISEHSQKGPPIYGNSHLGCLGLCIAGGPASLEIENLPKRSARGLADGKPCVAEWVEESLVR